MVASAAAPAPVLYGQDVQVKIFKNSAPLRGPSVLVKSLKVTEDATIHQNQYLGQSRAKNDKTVKGYTASLELDTADNALIEALLEIRDARDNNQPEPELTLGFSATERSTGRTFAYYLKKCVAKMDLGFGEREQPVSTTLEITAEDLKKAV